MLRRSIPAGLAVASFFGAACRETPEPDPIPAGVPGSYVYAGKGTTLKKLQWQFAAKLQLNPDGTFVLALDKTMNGQKDPTEHTRGTYTVSDQKVLLSGRQEGKSSDEQHALVIKPDSLIGEIGWTTHIILRGLGAPDPVFVRQTAG
jgi:hypothetical protein